MAQSRGSVRIGPVSLFVLVITVCLAVLAVLSITTAHAEQAVTNQQATAVTDTYRNEIAAQEFLAALDGCLEGQRTSGVTGNQDLRALEAFIADYNDRDGNQGLGESAIATLDGSIVTVEFVQASGRKLIIRVLVDEDWAYRILSWRASTEWEEPGSDNELWEGTSLSS